MNTANKVTIARMILIPVFFVIMMSNIPYADIISMVIFAIAALTDGIDGHIARKYNQITDFGKFLDPLADKLLIATALIGFVELGRMPAWMAVIIIAREFIVTGLRSIAASKGVVIAAIMTGKIKTVIQLIAIICTMLFSRMSVLVCGYPAVGFVTMAISTLFTIYSGYEYIARNANLLKDM